MRDGDIDAAIRSFVIVIFRDLNSCLCISRLFADFMKSADTALICYGKDNTFFFDVIDIMPADVMDSAYNLLGKSSAYSSDHSELSFRPGRGKHFFDFRIMIQW